MLKSHIAGVVLAGGQSRRFGRDKAEAELDGLSLLDWSLRALAPHVGLLLVSGRPHPLYAEVVDSPEPGHGPLGGLAGAMIEAARHGCSHLLSLPCDTPRVTAGQLAGLCRDWPDGAYAAACPVIGLWPARLGAPLSQYLSQGGDKAVRGWALLAGIPAVDGFEGLENINLADDLARLASGKP